MSDIAQYKVSEQIMYPAHGNQMNQSLPRHSSSDLIDSLAIPKRVIVPTIRYIPASRKKPIAFASSDYGPVKVNAMMRLELEEKFDPKQNKKAVQYNPGACIYRTNDKSRGLRYFSSKVCEKVKMKGQTNYNEVADELVAEYFDSFGTNPESIEKQQYDMKNIRRRIYDAINVLTAMNIIEKDKKVIRWVGLPTNSDMECKKYQEEKIQRQESIRKKREQLQELVGQLVAHKSLIQRNRENEKTNGRPADSKLLYLPFIVLNTSQESVIDCSIAQDKTEFLFSLNQSFEICDDMEVLKRLSLSRGIAAASESPQSEEDRKFIKSCLPPALQSYADEILDGNFVAKAPAHEQTLASIPAPTSQPQQQLQQQVLLPAPSQLPYQHASTSADLKLPMYNNNSVATDSTGRNSNSSFQRVITRPKFRSCATNVPYTIPSTNYTTYRNFGQQQQHNYALNPNPSFLGQRRYVRRYPTTSYSTNQHVFGGLNERSTLQFEDDILCNEDGYIQFEG